MKRSADRPMRRIAFVLVDKDGRDMDVESLASHSNDANYDTSFLHKSRIASRNGALVALVCAAWIEHSQRQSWNHSARYQRCILINKVIDLAGLCVTRSTMRMEICAYHSPIQRYADIQWIDNLDRMFSWKKRRNVLLLYQRHPST